MYGGGEIDLAVEIWLPVFFKNRQRARPPTLENALLDSEHRVIVQMPLCNFAGCIEEHGVPECASPKEFSLRIEFRGQRVADFLDHRVGSFMEEAFHRRLRNGIVRRDRYERRIQQRVSAGPARVRGVTAAIHARFARLCCGHQRALYTGAACSSKGRLLI